MTWGAEQKTARDKIRVKARNTTRQSLKEYDNIWITYIDNLYYHHHHHHICYIRPVHNHGSILPLASHPTLLLVLLDLIRDHCHLPVIMKMVVGVMMLMTGLHKLCHPVWEKMENMVNMEENMEYMEKKENINQTTISMTQNTLFVNQMTQNTLFYGVYGDG